VASFGIDCHDLDELCGWADVGIEVRREGSVARVASYSLGLLGDLQIRNETNVCDAVNFTLIDE
jgi:hypothetical protein